MQAVIIAGGKGTRLRPLTYGCPKPMLPLLGQPFLVWMVERCRQAGITDILLNVQYQAHQVSDYFGDGSAYGVRIRYVEEAEPLDTAGAMKLAEQYFTGESLVVFNADILTDLDLNALIQFHKASGAQATLTLSRVEDPTAFGLVELTPENRVLAFREKPTAEEAAALGIDTINAGTYVLEPELFAPYAVGKPLSFEKTVFPELLTGNGKMMGFVWEGYWMDLGTPAKFYQAQLDILTGNMPYALTATAQERAPGVWVANSAEVDPAAKLEGPCYVGEQAKLGPKAHLPAGTLIGPQSLINRPLNPGVYAAGTLAV
ncbi:sugar phosphate nucleotidyltransferase [Leptolyngbya sp. FACHB-261]|uniref:sugar phosphate nucleotidyltransferase n=1 Tax=Leptolyngbya sp. FACHB-261 TaxID=2692806 RepID=UPI001689815A|nr:NDP-sugar synthase [Leptolyngbya sp. FACHB-261]MBD2104202.1 NDP-sugar synthase [Leptolyngbya sp. FACHB-261]